MTTIGSSVITASPNASAFRPRPGPEVVVIPLEPANDAPIAEQIPAISSSAWNVLTPKFLYFESSCKISEAGVIGYDPKNNCRPDFTDAATNPNAVASFPITPR